MGLLSKIKADVERTGSNRAKVFYVKSGEKVRIRFLDDMDDGREVIMHDRWDPMLKVPCAKNKGEDEDCDFCGVDGIRTRVQYAWHIWDYENNEVKLFMFAANNCSPIPSLVALYETYGTITDRDYTIGRAGTGTGTTYSMIPLDKSNFRNQKAKKFSAKEFWGIIKDAFPAPDDSKPKGKGGKDDDEEWDDDKYINMSPKELYVECKKRDLSPKPKKSKEYYIKMLQEDDELPFEDEDEDFWGED